MPVVRLRSGDRFVNPRTGHICVFSYALSADLPTHCTVHYADGNGYVRQQVWPRTMTVKLVAKEVTR